MVQNSERLFVYGIQDTFPDIEKPIVDGYDVPMYCRDLIAQITDVTEDEWSTEKDPSSKITNENTLRSFTKRGFSKKFASSIVYRLTPDKLVKSINKRPHETRQALAEDLSPYFLMSQRRMSAESLQIFWWTL